MTGCVFSWLATVISAAAVGTLLGVCLGRGRAQARPTAPRTAAALAPCRRHLAAVERENVRLRERVQTLESQLRTVVGRGCIITVDWRKPQR